MLKINSYEKQCNNLIIERDELIEQINELKHTIEQQETMIDKMKNCYNCKNIDTVREICEIYGCKNEDKWMLKDD